MFLAYLSLVAINISNLNQRLITFVILVVVATTFYLYYERRRRPVELESEQSSQLEDELQLLEVKIEKCDNALVELEYKIQQSETPESLRRWRQAKASVEAIRQDTADRLEELQKKLNNVE